MRDLPKREAKRNISYADQPLNEFLDDINSSSSPKRNAKHEKAIKQEPIRKSARLNGVNSSSDSKQKSHSSKLNSDKFLPLDEDYSSNSVHHFKDSKKTNPIAKNRERNIVSSKGRPRKHGKSTSRSRSNTDFDRENSDKLVSNNSFRRSSRLNKLPTSPQQVEGDQSEGLREEKQTADEEDPDYSESNSEYNSNSSSDKECDLLLKSSREEGLSDTDESLEEVESRPNERYSLRSIKKTKKRRKAEEKDRATSAPYQFRNRSKEYISRMQMFMSLKATDDFPIISDEENQIKPRKKSKAKHDDKPQKTEDQILPINIGQIASSRTHLDIKGDIPAYKSTVSLEDIGGLTDQLKKVREALLLPVMHPEFCEHYRLPSTRGILFHGPPGTGKTLMAKAMVNECSKAGSPIAFFHINSNDVLSKWVGKSEAKVKAIFDAATLWQPSVIFIDEIDGLAPPRKSEDRHNASLVASLLSQMDGLTSTGKILVIGATNRINSLDPALRRPGRFDTELLFGLPNYADRLSILNRITSSWLSPPPQSLLEKAAELTVNYSGASLAKLCSDIGISAFKRVSTSTDANMICAKDVTVNHEDLLQSLGKSIPVLSQGLSYETKPLTSEYSHCEERVNKFFQHMARCPPLLHLVPFYLVEGTDSLTVHAVVASLLNKFEDYKVVPVDLANFGSTNELAAVNLFNVTMNPFGGKTIYLIQYVDKLKPFLPMEIATLFSQLFRRLTNDHTIVLMTAEHIDSNVKDFVNHQKIFCLNCEGLRARYPGKPVASVNLLNGSTSTLSDFKF